MHKTTSQMWYKVSIAPLSPDPSSIILNAVHHKSLKACNGRKKNCMMPKLDALLHFCDVELNMALHLDVLIMSGVDLVLDVVFEFSHLY